jgi:hypothetical protein
MNYFKITIIKLRFFTTHLFAIEKKIKQIFLIKFRKTK